MTSIDFYFDFISPFGYFASLRIDAIAAAHGRETEWHSMLLGVSVMKVMGLKPLLDTPLKGEYIRREVARYARRHCIRLARDPGDPMMDPRACARAFYWVKAATPGLEKALARALFAAYWLQGRDLSTPEAVAEIAAPAGFDPADLMAGIAGEQKADTDLEQLVGIGHKSPVNARHDAVGRVFAYGVDGIVYDDRLRYEAANPNDQRRFLLERTAVIETVRCELIEREGVEVYPVQVDLEDRPDGSVLATTPLLPGRSWHVAVAGAEDIAVAVAQELTLGVEAPRRGPGLEVATIGAGTDAETIADGLASRLRKRHPDADLQHFVDDQPLASGERLLVVWTASVGDLDRTRVLVEGTHAP